ncbi:MAG: IPT/TIG domain-containing protein [Methanoregula sp.]|uniref:IPT/TIG domain-containing protein n=1 Tax=Methanoregula sp. TaxID=2052170 RepID=UPI003C1AE95C
MIHGTPKNRARPTTVPSAGIPAKRAPIRTLFILASLFLLVFLVVPAVSALPVITGISPGTGPQNGGNTVNITGTDLVAASGTPTVQFNAGGTDGSGGASAPATIVGTPTASSISVTAPFSPVVGGGGYVDVEVTNNDGTSVDLPADEYNYVTILPSPNIVSITPGSGYPGGGQPVEIDGTNFVNGNTFGVTIGGFPALNVVYVSPTEITAETPGGPAGTMQAVVLTNYDGQTATSGYFYDANPTATTILPSAGSVVGGQSVTITGTNFITGSGLGVTIGGNAATNVVVVDPTTITATTPAGSGTGQSVIVTIGDGQTATATGTYTYDPVPTISTISPSAGSVTGGQTVTITGTNFEPAGTSAGVTMGGHAATVVSHSATQIVVTTPAGTAGSQSVVVTISDGQTATTSYTYDAVPTVTGISPSHGSVSGGQTITIKGTHLQTSGSSLGVTIDGVAATSVTAVNPTTITATTPAGAAGVKNVVVTIGDGQTVTDTGAYTYDEVPTATTVTPSAGSAAGGQTVTIAGTHFISGTSLGVTIGGNAATNVVVINPDTITATIPAGSVGAPQAVIVTNGDGQTVTATGTYTYDAVPTATIITSSIGSVTGGQSVTITGTNFVTGPSLGVSIGGHAATSVVVVNATAITATTPAGSAGVKNVVVTIGDGQTATDEGAYTYDAVPTVTGITPSAGSVTGGQSVTISGTYFIAGTSLGVTIGGAPATSVSFVNANTITARTPAGSAGVKNVVVTSADGQTATDAGAYTYDAVPTATGITPSAGPVTGGQSVTITGTNFITGPPLGVTVGGNAATSVVVVNPTTITATTPAGTAGSQPVVVTIGDGQTATVSGTYTYDAVPTVTRIMSYVGPVAGGQSVTITGTNFITGASLGVTIGGNAATSVVVVNPTTITATTPAGTDGAKNVVVTIGDGQTATDAGAYVYDPIPTVTTISPSAGSVLGTQTVTITGTNLSSTGYSSLSVTIGGNAARVWSNTATTVSAETPAGTAGVKDVVVTIADGQTATLPGAYTYDAVPTVTGITPSAGPVTGGQSVTITGTNFITGASLDVIIGSNSATNIVVVNPTTITATTSTGTDVHKDVVVVIGDGQTAIDNFAYTYDAVPTATTLLPWDGSVLGGQSLTITGTNFITGPSLGVTIGGNAATNVVVVSPTTITATTPAGTGSARPVVVTIGDGQSATDAGVYTYDAVPTVTTISPSAGQSSGGTTLTITGTNFEPAGTSAAVTIGGNAATVVSHSATHIVVTTPAGAPGTRPVIVTISDGQTATGTYTYDAAPTITGITPSAGPVAGGQPVTITGTNLNTTGTSLGMTIDSLPATNVVVINNTTITATTPADAAGVKTVVVTIGDGQTATDAGAYTYDAQPTLTGITPSAGSVLGGQPVTISGTYLSSTGTSSLSVTIGGAPATILTASGTTITATTPPGTTGVKNIVVTIADGQTATDAGAYTYDAVPTTTGITPSAGPVAGGQPVTITGTNLNTTGTSLGVTIGGNAATNVVLVNPTTITARTPAGTAGVKDVVVTIGDGQTATDAGAYTYDAVPTVTGITLSAGSVAGGQPVTITGTNLQTSGTSLGVTIGGNAATNVVVVNPTTITARTPAGTAGVQTVIVTIGDGQTATDAGAYTYDAVPTATGITPSMGSVAGGQSVTITGTNLQTAGTSLAVTIGGNAATSVSFVNSTTITATTPAGTAGAQNLVVTIGDGQTATLSGSYTYIARPVVSNIAPTSGPTTGNTVVMITGTALSNATVVKFGNTVVPMRNITVDTANLITLIAPSNATAGSPDIIVTTPGGTSATSSSDQYTYQAVPTVTSISPTAGPVTAGTTVTITGSNLAGATTVNFGSTPGTITANTATSITATAPGGSGTVDITVSTPSGTSAPVTSDKFTYIALPVVSGISPKVGPLTAGTRVTITGTAFTGATEVDFGSTPATGVTVVSATSVTATAPAGTAGTVDVTVTTAGSTSVTSASDQYTYEAVPTVTSISPTAGPLTAGTTVTIAGTGLSGPTAVKFGSTAGTILTNSSTSITVTAPSGTAGIVDVTVTTPGGTSATGSGDKYTYTALPVVTSISPVAGPLTAGTRVTITGTGLAGPTAVKFGSTAGTILTNSSTSITATAPAGAAGTVDVTITTLGGTSATSASDKFTYVALPVVSRISPAAGPLTAGTTVTITGTGFTGAVAVNFGSTAATHVSVVSATSVTATAPAGAAGTVDVTVTTAGSTSVTSASDQYTYEAVPTVSSISPTAGPLTAGTTVTIAGTGLSGPTAVKFGSTAGTILTNSSTSITVTAPAGTAGVVNVTVTTPGGTSATGSGNKYTYTALPVVSRISPAVGPLTAGTTVTITGTGLTGATTVNFGSTPGTITANTATSISVTAPGGSGAVDITVITPGGTSPVTPADKFTYQAAPFVSSTSPIAGSVTGGRSVTLYGTGFTGATVVDFGSTPATITANTGSLITVIAPAHAAGVVDVTVTTLLGTSATGTGDQYTYEAAAPTVSGISPTSGSVTGGTSVTITGTAFTGATAVNFGSVTGTITGTPTATSITATAPAGTAGIVDVTVITPGGTSATGTGDQYTYVVFPVVGSISPASGSVTGGQSVTITGTNLTGVTAVKFGSTAATHVTVVSATSITATAPAGSGIVNVTVIKLGKTSTVTPADKYTYVAAPVVSSISPKAGPLTDGQSVTITGTGFTGATTVNFGGTAATHMTVVSGTSITATAPAHAAGVVDVTVITPGGTSAMGTGDKFTYQAAPVVSRISPMSSSHTGGTTVTITGTGFTGATTVNFGGTAATHMTVVSGTSITATAPAHAAGVVDVTVITPGGTSATGTGDKFTYT